MSTLLNPRAPWMQDSDNEPEAGAIVPAGPSEPWRSAGGVLSAEPLTDEKIISLWLARFDNANTQRSYRKTIEPFVQAVGSLGHLTIDRVQAWRRSLTGTPATQGQRIAAVKSLLRFTYDFGVHPVNLGRLLAYPKCKNTLAERIMSKEHVLAMIDAARGHKRDYALLRVLYSTGCRVSELTGLCWRDVQARENGDVQLTLYGKGSKTRFVLLDNPETCKALLSIRHGREDGESVFESRTGSGRLDRVSVHRLMKKWAKAAGLPAGIAGKISAHWFRHGHASHALDAGAPIHEVQATLGHADISTTGRYLHCRPDHSSGRFLAV